jgi:hypothetical protein
VLERDGLGLPGDHPTPGPRPTTWTRPACRNGASDRLICTGVVSSRLDAISADVSEPGRAGMPARASTGHARGRQPERCCSRPPSRARPGHAPPVADDGHPY